MSWFVSLSAFRFTGLDYASQRGLNLISSVIAECSKCAREKKIKFVSK